MSNLFVPIVVALVLSEVYIIVAALLGVFVNKEKLRLHQVVGIIIAIVGVITLSVFYS